MGRRLAAAVLLLAVGVVALVYGITSLFAVERGWQTVQASSSAEMNCGGDFTLLYDLGSSGAAPAAEKKALVGVYTQAVVKAYRLFTNDGEAEDERNIWYLNRHPNETVTVDPALYAALEQVSAAGDRALYLGPVYEAYDGIFYCQDDAQAAGFDPRQDQALRSYFARCAGFANDSAAVDVTLLGEDRVRLSVSDEYLAFAREQQIESFIDFYWMKNAFIIDYLADTLADNGYTNGVLSSFDGFVRNLSGTGEPFALELYDRGTSAGTVTYTGPMSFVCLRSYPLNGQARQYYYELADGQVRSACLDTADGLCRAALDDLVVCARDMGCGEMLLRARPLYAADRLDSRALDTLHAAGMGTVLCDGGAISCQADDLVPEPAEGYTAGADRS